jgi:hypothetical protein
MLDINDQKILRSLLGLAHSEMTAAEMVTRLDLDTIARCGVGAWIVVSLGDLPQPLPQYPASEMLCRFILGEASAALRQGITSAAPVERVGRVLLVQVDSSRWLERFALVICPPRAARPALWTYASAFEHLDQPSAWLTDDQTHPAARLAQAEALLIRGGGLGFSRRELAYLLVHIRHTLSRVRS